MPPFVLNLVPPETVQVQATVEPPGGGNPEPRLFEIRAFTFADTEWTRRRVSAHLAEVKQTIKDADAVEGEETEPPDDNPTLIDLLKAGHITLLIEIFAHQLEPARALAAEFGYPDDTAALLDIVPQDENAAAAILTALLKAQELATPQGKKNRKRRQAANRGILLFLAFCGGFAAGLAIYRIFWL